MMKLFILYENKNWMPPITDALKRKNIAFELWHISNMTSIDLTRPPPKGVFFNRMSPSAHHRGYAQTIEHTFEILNWLEQAGRRVINPSPLWRIILNLTAIYHLPTV